MHAFCFCGEKKKGTGQKPCNLPYHSLRPARRAAAVAKLGRAILKASDWATDPANVPRFAHHLSAPDRLALPVDVLEPILRFEIRQGAGRPPRQIERFVRFDRAALRRVAFSSTGNRRRLNGATHPAIARRLLWLVFR